MLNGLLNDMIAQISYDSISLRKPVKLKLIVSYSLLFAVLFLPTPAHAAIQWSLSVVEGYYLPKLDELNYVLKNTLVELGPRNTEAKPSPYPVIYQGASPEMPEMSPKAPKIGLQMNADLNPRFAVVFGGSMATFDSQSRDVRPFFVGFSIPATRETRFSLTLNQFWIGVRRYWTLQESEDKSKKPPGKTQDKPEDKPQNKKTQGPSPPVVPMPASRLYAEMGLLAVTRAYLTTDVWLHVYAQEEGFDFYKVTETGIGGNGYATYLGVGGEYYFRKWLAFCFDIDYDIGGVANMRFANYFTVDPLEKDIIKPGDKVTYTDLKKGRIVPLFLDLGGWDLKGQIRMYFN